MTTTTPLPPSSLSPKYKRVEDLIEDVWDRSMEIEQEYYETGNSKLVQSFAMYVVIIQFWEDVHMRILGDQARADDKKG